MNTTKTVPNLQQIQNGVTWIGGATDQLQKQHIPGYQGHIHGLFSENVHGKNFARVTAQCLNQRNNVGIDIPKEQKYTSSYKHQFDQPDLRRNQFINTAQSILGKLEKQQQEINQTLQNSYQKQPKNIKQVPPIDRIPVVGYMGFKPTFRHPIKQIQQPRVPEQVILPERQVYEQMVKTGFYDQKKVQSVQKNTPVVGYCGFLKGIKAGNQYAQSFEQLARNSIRK